MSPLTKAGKKTLQAFIEQYGEEKGKEYFYRSENKGIPGSETWTRKTIHSGHKKIHKRGD